mgnify:CR=1 FL=1
MIAFQLLRDLRPRTTCLHEAMQEDDQRISWFSTRMDPPDPIDIKRTVFNNVMYHVRSSLLSRSVFSGKLVLAKCLVKAKFVVQLLKLAESTSKTLEREINFKQVYPACPTPAIKRGTKIIEARYVFV